MIPAVPFLHRAICALGLALSLLASTTLRAAPTEIELVLDASGSMWNKLEDGRYRIDAAKQVLTDFLAQVPADPNLRIGLRIYGARVHYSKPGACEDSELVAPIAPLDRARLLAAVRATRAVGATPLAYSLQLAAKDFRESGRKQVIVCTDGEESCGGNVAEAVAALKALGADVDVRFIGIGLPAAAAIRLGKIAPIENVNSARRLAEALQTATRPTLQPSKPATATPPKAPPALPTVRVRVVRDGKPVLAPEAAVSFRADLGDGAAVELKLEGGEFTAALKPGSYTATVKPGGRQFRGLGVLPDGANRFVFDLSEAPKVTVTPAKLTVLGGTTLSASFAGAKGTESQYLVLAPVGSPDNEEPVFIGVKGTSGTGELSVPDAPGKYEVRFASRVVEGGGYVIGGRSVPVTVTGASATLEAPATAVAGTAVKVRWTGPNRPKDWVGFVKKGGSYADYLGFSYAEGEAKEASVETPGVAGEYEIVYANDNSGTILARRPITITPPQITLDAPATAEASGSITIRWSGPNRNKDWVGFIKKGGGYADYLGYAHTEGDTYERQVSTPGQPGEYEVVYASDSSGAVLARRPITITAPQVTLNAPATAMAGSDVKISWAGPSGSGQFVTIVKPSAEPSAYTEYVMLAAEERSIVLGAPEEPGDYEVRYASDNTRVVLTRHPIRLTPAVATLDAPASAATGGNVTVKFTGPGGKSDQVQIAKAGEPDDGSPETYFMVQPGTSSGELSTPAPGRYELRYLSKAGKVLARRPITIR